MSLLSNPPTRFTPSRALLKVSGAGFGGDTPLDAESIDYIADQVESAVELGIELALVVGGGNVLRGADQDLLSRTAGDFAGMVATIVNGIVLKDSLEDRGLAVQLQSALPVDGIAKPVDSDQADERLGDSGIVIFAGGTGNPYFTTDSAAALRAGEIGADLILKGTDVDGVYSGDPAGGGEAEFITELTYERMMEEELGVIDLTAARICRETGIPMVVYDLFTKGNTAKILRGKEIGTFVYPTPGQG
ncbi:MAG: uridine monophosphate kinase [Candidatus Acetothermia bacterium]